MVIVIVEVATTLVQPADVTVLVTAYVPAVLEESVTNPVAALMLNPAGAVVKVPATPPPLKVGDGLAALLQ